VGSSANHDCGGMMPGHSRIGRLLVPFREGLEPVLGPPSGGIRRIDRDDRDPDFCSHRNQSVPELASRDACDGTAEPLATHSAARRFPGRAAGVGEVQILNRDRLAATPLGGLQQEGDGVPQ
jgi:hypothetical protein